MQHLVETCFSGSCAIGCSTRFQSQPALGTFLLKKGRAIGQVQYVVRDKDNGSRKPKQNMRSRAVVNPVGGGGWTSATANYSNDFIVDFFCVGSKRANCNGRGWACTSNSFTFTATVSTIACTFGSNARRRRRFSDIRRCSCLIHGEIPAVSY